MLFALKSIRVSASLAVASAIVCASSASALPGPPLDRGDLAIGYERLDTLMTKLPNDPVVRERASRCFDGLTRDFFSGQYDNAMAEVARLHGELLRLNDAGQMEMQFIYGHRYEVTPRAISVGEKSTVRLANLELQRMLLGTPPRSLIAVGDGFRVEIPYGDEVEFQLPATAKPGHIEIQGKFKWVGAVPLARIAVLERSLESLRTGFESRIAALKAKDAINAAELASLNARAGLLSEEVDRNRSVSLFADLPRIAQELDEELTRAEAGQRPFAASGDVWRIYRVLGTELPVRQFVPKGAGPFPLVIAFHGAGGDENMFFEGYGDGALRRSAAGEAFVAVCPPTVPFGVSQNLLEAFIDELAKDIPIDRTRIGLIGHSLGGVTASRLAVLKPKLITGAVCIAGFADLARSGIPAARKVLLAELDPLFPLESTKASIESARARGESIEIETVRHEGHTLVVGQVVPQAVRWLLGRPALTIDATKPTASAPSTTPMKTGGPNPSEKVASPSSGPRK